MKAPALVLAAILSVGLTSLAEAEDAKAPAPAAATPDALKDPQARISYAIGLNLGANFRRDSVTVDPQMMAQGVRDVMTGAKPLMSDDQVRATLIQLETILQTRRSEKAALAAETNKTQGDAFLKANAAKPGVVILPSGLQYQVLTQGAGPTPKGDDTVVCNYRGTLIDGTEFDSSYTRGTPSTFPVGGVIKGWTEALQKMPVGSKWRLFVPSDLAYGERGSGANIGPNAVLIFDVELLSVQAKG